MIRITFFHQIACGRVDGRTRKYIEIRKMCRRESAIIVSFFIIASRSQFKHNYISVFRQRCQQNIYMSLAHKHTRARHMLCTECSLRGRASRTTVSYGPNNNRSTHVPFLSFLFAISLARFGVWSGLWFPVRYPLQQRRFFGGQLDIYGCVFVSMFMIIMCFVVCSAGILQTHNSL